MRYLFPLACTLLLTATGCRSTCHTCGCHSEWQMAPAGESHIEKAPAPEPPAPAPEPEPPAEPVTVIPTHAPVQAPAPIQVSWKPGEADYGRAPDFSWLIGRIQRVHAGGGTGTWKIRYAPLDQRDYWGGSVVLAEDARIDKFKDGDFVFVEGDIIARRPTVYVAGPLYRVSSIRKVNERDHSRLWAQGLQKTTLE